jgi:hypothetical protein
LHLTAKKIPHGTASKLCPALGTPTPSHFSFFSPNKQKTEHQSESNFATSWTQIGIVKDFISRTPKPQQLRQRMDKWDYMKLKSFCTMKEIVSKLKSSPTEWKKMFASYISKD